MDVASFTPEHRLRSKADFDRVFARAFRSRGRYFTVLGRAAAGPRARLGLAISRKVDLRAVGRNRIKRVVRETFRTNLASLPAVDIVVMARHDAREASNNELRNALLDHWGQLARAATKNKL